jgi:tetratricopeptide (TPR) repeat protein
VLIAGFVCFAGGCNSSFERVDPQRIADLEARDARGDASIAEVLLLARLLIEADRSEDSLARVDRLITTDLVEEAERQNVRGLALEQLVRLGDAYDAYEAALAAVSDYPPTLVRKAAFHYRSGDLERSRLLAARAVSLSPGAAEGWYYLYLLALTPSDQQQALLGLIAADDQDGTWSVRALGAR